MRGTRPGMSIIAIAAALGPGGEAHATGGLASDLAAPSVDSATPVVVVSARKRDETIVDAPLAVTVFNEQALADYGIRNFADYAAKVPGLSYGYGNGASAGETGTGLANARTIAVRGVAGARTTAYYIDDTPLPGAIDARVLDLRGIEILKGPQGTLYGESSMGGNVRLLSQAPDLQAHGGRLQLEAGHTSGADGPDRGASGAANIVLAPGRAALRLAGFADDLGGYLERAYLSDIERPLLAPVTVGGQAAQRGAGGSVTALLRVSPRLDMTLRVLRQYRRDHGIAAMYAPLPAFRPVEGIVRSADVQPLAQDAWTLRTVALSYAGKGWRLASSTGYFTRLATDVEDSTEGTTQYLATYGYPVPPQPFAWTAHRRSRQWTHETRVAFEDAGIFGGIFSGIVGIHYASLQTLRDTPPLVGRDVLGVPGQSLLWEYTNGHRQRDLSLFGELYARLPHQLTLTVGARWYRLAQRDHTSFDGAIYGVPLDSATSNRSSGNSPKVALAYQPDGNRMLYASASKGFRAGGSQADLTPLLGGCVSAEEARRLARVDSDTLWSYEAGGKLLAADGGLLVTGALYQVDWDRIQQPAFVPTCFFYLLGNAGAARIRGAELEATGRIGKGLSMRVGAGYTDARITEQGSSRQQAGERIRQVPQWNATVGAAYTTLLAPGMTGFASMDASHTGASMSSNATTQALRRPAYTLANARFGVRWQRSELALHIRNIGDARVNLGDLGYLGYLRFEADGKTPLPQVATLPPRAVSLQYSVRY